MTNREREPYPFTREEIERDVHPALRDLQAKVREAIKTHDQIVAALKAGHPVPLFASGQAGVFGAEGLRNDFVLRDKRLTAMIYRALDAVYEPEVIDGFFVIDGVEDGEDGEDDGPDLCTVEVPVWNSNPPRVEACGMELDCPTHGPAREDRPEAAAPAAG